MPIAAKARANRPTANSTRAIDVRPGELRGNVLFHRPQLTDRLLGIDTPDRLPRRLGQEIGITRWRAHDGVEAADGMLGEAESRPRVRAARALTSALGRH